jgi:hypothetical protein
MNSGPGSFSHNFIHAPVAEGEDSPFALSKATATCSVCGLRLVEDEGRWFHANDQTPGKMQHFPAPVLDTEKEVRTIDTVLEEMIELEAVLRTHQGTSKEHNELEDKYVALVREKDKLLGEPEMPVFDTEEVMAPYSEGDIETTEHMYERMVFIDPETQVIISKLELDGIYTRISLLEDTLMTVLDKLSNEAMKSGVWIGPTKWDEMIEAIKESRSNNTPPVADGNETQND